MAERFENLIPTEPDNSTVPTENLNKEIKEINTEPSTTVTGTNDTVTKPTENAEPTKTTNEDNSVPKEFNIEFPVDTLLQQFGVEVPEDKKTHYTNDINGLLNYMEDLQTQTQELQKQEITYKTEEARLIDDYVSQGGDVQELLKELAQGKQVSSTDLSTEQGQKQTIINYLITKGYEEDDAKLILDNHLKKSDYSLEEQAKVAKNELSKILQQKQQTLLQQQEFQKQQQQLETQRQIETQKQDLVNLVKSAKNLQVDNPNDFLNKIINIQESPYGYLNELQLAIPKDPNLWLHTMAAAYNYLKGNQFQNPRLVRKDIFSKLNKGGNSEGGDSSTSATSSEPLNLINQLLNR